MYTVLNKDGSFAGTTYNEITDAIQKHHEQYGQTFMQVLNAPVDVAPAVEGEQDWNHVPDYGSPTAEQIEATRIWTSNKTHQAYLDFTDWYVLRKVETGEEIPAEVLTQRAEARAALGK